MHSQSFAGDCCGKYFIEWHRIGVRSTRLGVIAKTLIFLLMLAWSLQSLAQQEDLKVSYQEKVKQKLYPPPDEISRYSQLASAALRHAGLVFSVAQYAAVVDRSPQVQAIFIFWFPLGTAPMLIGASSVSTGLVGRIDHFETPTGVFDHHLANPDFRAEGTKNKLGFRGYGAKGLRVYDMGWQTGKRGWGRGGESLMSMQMHSTDAILAEPLLGSVRSEGCVRIPATLNWLIDHFGLLDADYAAAQNTGRRLWVLAPDRTPVKDPGRYLIVVDSLQENRPDWLLIVPPDARSK